jgi:2,3-bisphosphoglycerate-independent phosphoglycerate mutase
MQNKSISHGAIQMANMVRQAYERGQTDYSMEPLVRINPDDGATVGPIRDGDAVIFCCRRGEREVELTEVFTDPEFTHFPRKKINLADFVILTLYHEKFKDLCVAFAPTRGSGTLCELVSQAGLQQFRCSESEKFAHITYFLNGGINEAFPGEIDKRIPSIKGIPFDQVPELSLPKVADEVIQALQKDYDLVITNFANGDVIGHTASTPAKVSCAEAVDHHLSRVVNQALQNDYITLITADHGNLEVLFTPEGKPHVAHTTNPVPLIILDPRASGNLKPADGILADLSPTILSMLNLQPSPEMNGRNLLSGHPWEPGRKVLLVILDGWGIGKQDKTNPIFLGKTPFWDEINEVSHPSQLAASGEAVGLQAGKPGNSEAGHMNIGAGRVVLQDDVRLDLAIKDGSFAANPVFLQTIEKVKRQGSCLHLIGLLTEKSSHGSIDYPLAICSIAKEQGLDQVFLHLILDGRSTEPGSAPMLLDKLELQLQTIGMGQVATAVGRGIALDRDGNYDKVKKAYDAMVSGIGQQST